MSVLVLLYNFSSAQTEPPTSSQIRFNDSLYANVSTVWVRNVTTDGADMRVVWLNTPVGTDLYVQDKNDSTTFARFTLTAAPIDKTTYVELAVVAVAHGGSSLINNQAVMAILITAPDPVTPPLPDDDSPVLDFAHVRIPAPLVSLAVVKDHLHVRDSYHDADINQKVGAAQEDVLAWLSYAVDPLWTESTVPKAVQHSILLLTSALYENRGGEDADTKIAKAWDEIKSLLGHYHDPTLA